MYLITKSFMAYSDSEKKRAYVPARINFYAWAAIMLLYQALFMLLAASVYFFVLPGINAPSPYTFPVFYMVSLLTVFCIEVTLCAAGRVEVTA